MRNLFMTLLAVLLASHLALATPPNSHITITNEAELYELIDAMGWPYPSINQGSHPKLDTDAYQKAGVKDTELKEECSMSGSDSKHVDESTPKKPRVDRKALFRSKVTLRERFQRARSAKSLTLSSWTDAVAAMSGDATPKVRKPAKRQPDAPKAPPHPMPLAAPTK